jgi:hypothetical protein
VNHLILGPAKIVFGLGMLVWSINDKKWNAIKYFI